VIASMVSQLFMGRWSASTYQVARRAGHLERRFVLPLRTALVTDGPTVPPDTTVEEFVWQHLLGNRQQAVPVVDGACYRGIMRIDEAMAVGREDWPTTTVGESMRSDFPTIGPNALLRDALVTMEAADVDLLPVVDGETFVGVVTTDEILSLDEILGRAEGET
jgi:predicted transcriptional regulator